MRRGSVVAVVLVGVLAACGGSSAQLAASTDPHALQQKMAIVQAQFQAEQKVLDQNEDAILNIVGGGGGNAFVQTLFDLLEDPSSFFESIGNAAESMPPETLVAAWATHADAWCALDPSGFDDDFFLIYGGPHVLAALVAFLHSACGHDQAAALVAAAHASDLGEGMAASGVPGSGISLDALLDQLDGARGD